MGNLISQDGVSSSDINDICEITKLTSYPYDHPIWNSVFTMKGYLQNLSKSYLTSITTQWSHDMRIWLEFDFNIDTNTIQTHNFEVFILHMSEIVNDVPRRLLKQVSVILFYQLPI